MKNLITLFVTLFVVTTVSFAQTKEEKKKAKEEKKEQGFQEMKDLIDTGAYEFEGQWAVSQRGRRINLTTNPTFLRIEDDKSDVFLPFFGERYTGGGSYGTDSGSIEFETFKDYKVSYNDKKKQVIVSFIGQGKSDKFTCRMTVQSSGNASITVTSNHRSVMRYDGFMKAYSSEEKEN